MLPSIDILTKEITEQVYPNRTYQIDFNVVKLISFKTAIIGKAIIGNMMLGEQGLMDAIRINGYVDELEAVKQSIYLILSTERYQHLIYSWNYGIELIDLIGKPMPYVMAEIPRRIKEALTQDDRIEDVIDFEFEAKGKQLHVKFTVVSNVGNIPTKLEVDV